jgi:TonB family protein
MMMASILLALLAQQPAPAASASPEEPPPPADARTTAGVRIKEPRKTKHVAPKWPDNALRAGLNGQVVLETVIGVDGAIESVKVLKGNRPLTDAASEAVRKWRYTSTMLEGKPVPVVMTISVNFRLQGPPTKADVLASLEDPEPAIRWAAVRWLGRFRPVTGEQKQALQKALEDPNEAVSNAAREALAKLDTTL